MSTTCSSSTRLCSNVVIEPVLKKIASNPTVSISSAYKVRIIDYVDSDHTDEETHLLRLIARFILTLAES